MTNSVCRVVEDKKCTGCGVCACVCPNDAIKISEDEDGFLIPIIDTEKCTNCGLCKKCCPALYKNLSNSSNPECYAIMADDDTRRISSSGGMFTLLAEEFLNNGGYVCGAAFTDNWNVHHIIINDKKDLDKIRRSKYVQSTTGNIYTQIKDLLEQDRYVLFSGTPCQVAALKNYLNKDYEKFLTVDIVCHGVPSYATFKKFLSEQVNNLNKIKNINFREKERLGLNCLFSLTTENEKVYPQEFFRGFVDNLYLRDSCSSCNFIGLKRQGDITIGDFWRVKNYDKNLDDSIGTSLVLINNSKGQLYLDKIKPNCKKIKRMKLEQIDKTANPTLYHQPPKHIYRERFFELIKKRDFYHSWLFAGFDRYDIGLVGCEFANNYGAILTNYALYKALMDLNYEVLVIDKPRMLTNELFSDSVYGNTVARRFMKKYLKVSNIYNDENDLRELNEKCDDFIVGSDQIWNSGVNNPCHYYYFLDWVNNSRKKIAYATSFGNDKIYYDNDIKYNINYLLSEFDAVSVREDSGKKICEEEFNLNAEQTLDPVFIADKKHYEDLIAESSFELPDNEYIASYLLDAEKVHVDTVKFTENHFKLPSVNFTDLTSDKTKIGERLDNIFNNAEPETFLKVFKNAKFIVTNSFHGVCFSIIFNKPFICIPNKFRGYTRFKSLFKLLNINNRMIESIEELKQKSNLLDGMDYSEINKILSIEKDKSLNWLKSALKAPKKQANSSFDYLNSKIYDIKNQLLQDLSAKIEELEKQNKLQKYKIKLLANKSNIIKRYRTLLVLKLLTFGKNAYINKEYNDAKTLYNDIKLEEL